MPRKAQREWTQVSTLVGRITFQVQAKEWTDKDGTKHDAVPLTKGFVAEVSYASESDKMYHALCSSAVATQQTLKKFYQEHGRFPVAPGKPFKVTSSGGMDLPNTVIVDRFEAQAKSGTMALEDKIRAARAIGLEVPAEWLTQLEAAALGAPSSNSESTEGEEELKYNVEELRKLTTQKLRQLAQDEEMEDYDKAPRNELVDFLAEIEKE